MNRSLNEKQIFAKKTNIIRQTIKTKRLDVHSEKTDLFMEDKYKDSLTNRKVGEVFGANWTYDYFSLIESIKLDIEYKM